MDNIGSLGYAIEIRAFVQDNMNSYGRPSDGSKVNPPAGWRYLGHGSFRSVWQGPDGVAYKVQHSYGGYHSNGSSNSNSYEYDNLAGCWESSEVPKGTRLPKCSLYDGETHPVLAMELIKGQTLYEHSCEAGERDRYYDLLRRCEVEYDLSDLHDENVMIEEGTGLLIPVDFGA